MIAARNPESLRWLWTMTVENRSDVKLDPCQPYDIHLTTLVRNLISHAQNEALFYITGFMQPSGYSMIRLFVSTYTGHLVLRHTYDKAG